MVLNDSFMQSWQPAINNLYKQYGAPYGNNVPPPDGALADAKIAEAQRKTNYNAALKASQKKTYQDAVTYLSDPSIKSQIQKNGAYKTVESIRNDPTQQQAIKDQGYNVSDYINAIYNAASGGKFASERAYNQYTKQLKSQVKAKASAIPSIPTTAASAQQAAPQHNGGLGGFLGSLGHDIQRGYDRLIVNPAHAAEGAVNNFLSQEKAHITQAQKTGKSKGGISVNLGDIINAGKQGWNGKSNITGSDVLKTAGIKNKTAQRLGGGALDFAINPLNLVPYVGAEKLLGEGGLNIGSKLASELAPKFGNTIAHGVGKGLQGMATGALGASADASFNSHLTPQERLAELLQMSTLGGIGGALHGGIEGGSKSVNDALNKRITDMLPNIKKTDLTTSPQGYQDVLNRKALPAPSLYGNTKLPANNAQLAEIEKALNELHSTYQSKLNDHVSNNANQIDQAVKELQDKYKQELGNHVSNGMTNYLAKDSARQGNADLAKEYKNVKAMFPNGIKIPDHLKSDYADQLPKAFKETKGKSSSDLASVAEQLGHPSVDHLVQHLQNLDAANKAIKVSKAQDLGHSTANQAEKALQQEFHGTPNAQAMRQSLEYLQSAKGQALNDAKNAFHQTPDAQAIQMSIDHLNQAKENLGNQPGGIMRNDKPLSYVGKNASPVAEKFQKVDPNSAEQLSRLAGLKEKAPKEEVVNNTHDAINIDQAPQPKKLTKDELAREKNVEQFKANNQDPTIPDTSGHIMSKSDMPKMNKDLTDYYIAFHDDLHRLKQLQNDVVDAKGKPLPASEQIHTVALGTRGADVTADQLIKKNFVDMHGNVIEGVGPLKDITDQLKPNQYRDFRTYLANRHAITRMSRGEKVFPDEMKMSPEKSAQVVSAYENKYPKFKELADKYYKFNNALGDSWLVESGFIPKEEYNHMIQENPNYVPMNRVFDPIERHSGNQAKGGFLGQPKPIKKAPGSQRKIIDPIESTIENVAKYVKTARNNEVGQILVKHLTENPKALEGWAKIVPTEKGVSEFGDALGNGNLNEENLQNIIDKFNEAYDQKPNLEHGNVLPVMVDGKPVHVLVEDPRLLTAMTSLKPEQQSLIFKTIGEATRSFRVLTTGINPYFTVKNSARDVVDAYSNSKTLSEIPHKRIAAFSKDLLQAYWDVMTKKGSVQDFKNMGGGHTSSVASNTKLLARTKAQIVPSPTVADLKAEGKNFATTRVMAGKLAKSYQKVIGGIEHANNAIETAPRLAEYKRTVKQGGGTYDSKIQGVYNANDVTVNFNRKGKIAKQVDTLVPFFNASMQGIDKFGRTVISNPGKYAARMATIGLPAALLYFANANDPNYQQMSKYIKDQNFLIPKGDGTFIKIAKPREIGAIMDGMERTLDALYQHDPHAWQDYGKTLWSNFFPPNQTVDQPLIDAYANTSFTGAPIVSQGLSGLAPKYQYDAKDTSFAKNAAKVTSLLPILPEFTKSPKKIDYLLKSYGGGAAQLATAPTQSAKSTFTADPVYSNDTTTNFYNQKTNLDQARQAYMKKGITDPALNEPLRKQFDAQARQITKVRKAMNTIQNNNTLTPSQKKQQLRTYQQVINQMESALAK